MPGAGWLVWFSKSSPVLRSPIGIQVDSPLQRQWITLVRSGSIFLTAATVRGASRSSSRAVNLSVPTWILSMHNTNRPVISTHVLDLTRDRPASGVRVTLSRLENGQATAHVTRETDADGRIADLASVELRV